MGSVLRRDGLSGLPPLRRLPLPLVHACWRSRAHGSSPTRRRTRARWSVARSGCRPSPGPEAGFRNKAKMAVGGTVDAPTLGILDRDRSPGSTCVTAACTPPASRRPWRASPTGSRGAGLTPYDVATRSGELKHVLLTESPDGELMLRLVMRSTAPEARIRSRLPGAARRRCRRCGS